MAAQLGFAIERIALRKRELRFMFALSVAFHASLLALLVTSPYSFSRTPVVRLPGVISVDLVAAPAAATGAQKPVSKAAAPVKTAQAKPRAKPLVKKTVLPKEARRDPEKRIPDPKPAVQEKYADVLAQLRAEAGEVAPDRVATATTAKAMAKAQPGVAPRGSAGAGRLVSPEVAAWIRLTKIHIKRKWVLSPGFRTQDLETHVLVGIDARGGVRGEPKITRPSGNPWYDESVVRAILKSSPLPAPPEADRWPFIFVPEDSL